MPFDETTSRFTDCHAGCGTVVQYKASRKVYCPPCRAAAIKERSRLTAERIRRSRGVVQVKGTEFICCRCGGAGIRNGVHRKFCDACSASVASERARERSRRISQTEEGKAYASAWSKKKRRTDPAFRISVHVRGLIYRGIGKKKAGKSWRTFVPYTLEELMRHIERQFTKGMSWEAHGRGEIHIDHIRPLSSFEFTSPDDQGFKDAWALTNLRPMWARENIQKNGKRLFLI